MSFANVFPGLVVSRPTANGSNSSKPYQQSIIARHGFNIPATLVTTIPGDVRRFFEQCRGRVIFKSVSHERCIVSRLNSGNLSRAARVGVCPTMFQEFVAGVDIRVHVVGDELFATEIESDATDYRYAHLGGARPVMRSIQLPVVLRERCIQLAASLDLPLAGLDLRRTPDGDIYCFEVNPAPGFVFYEFRTGQPIGRAVVELLCRAAQLRKENSNAGQTKARQRPRAISLGESEATLPP